MSITNDKSIKDVFYANTQLQPLVDHLFAVGYLAERLHKHLLPNNTSQSTAVFIAGCLHDIGKIDPNFQTWLTVPSKKEFFADDGQHIDNTKFSFIKYPRHNEISVLLYHLLDSPHLKKVNACHKKYIKHTIYWHHLKPFRKEDFLKYYDVYLNLEANLKEISFIELLNATVIMLKKVCAKDTEYRQTEHSTLADCFDENRDFDPDNLRDYCLPSYKNYNAYEDTDCKYCLDIQNNANNNIVRACVISGDRLISKLSANDLHLHIKNNTLDELASDALLLKTNLCSDIEQCLKIFPNDERSNKQSELAAQLALVNGVGVLAGAAGCGKTKIALEWARLKDAQQIIWICPRVQICQGLFEELCSVYLPDTTIEINTGEFKFTNQWGKITPNENFFSGDIVVTTIDQVLSSIISHNKVNLLINYLNAHIVFDEFHEYVHMDAFNLFFAELIACKQQVESTNTLLVSATPHYFYLENILRIDKEDVKIMPSFNESLYQIEFAIFNEIDHENTNPFYQCQEKSTFVISNTALTAQRSFVFNQQKENAVLLHSKFIKSDKQKWFSEVYESFKKNGTKKFDILRSGPIVQASLNISCDTMVSEITNAENCLQRLGRLDRFGKNKTVNKYRIAVPESLHHGKETSSTAKFLSHQYILNATKAWYKYLQNQLGSTPVTLPTIYAWYQKFYEDDPTKDDIKKDLVKALKSSVSLINKKVLDPIRTSPITARKQVRVKISKNSLRGDNRFVQMAICDVNDPEQIQFLNEYAYQLSKNKEDPIDNITESVSKINGNGDSNKDLLAHMQKKHHTIFGGKKAHKDFILLNQARDEECPIYLSYTPGDLDAVGGESSRHSEAIYYAKCDKQPIGAISINQLKKQEE